MLSGAKPSLVVSSNPLSGGRNAHGSLKNYLGDIAGQRSRWMPEETSHHITLTSNFVDGRVVIKFTSYLIAHRKNMVCIWFLLFKTWDHSSLRISLICSFINPSGRPISRSLLCSFDPSQSSINLVFSLIISLLFNLFIIIIFYCPLVYSNY